MHDHNDRRRRRRRSRDHGISLIEIVVSVALLGLVVIPVLAAMSSLTKASATSRAAANVETVLINATDRVNRAPRGECDFSRFVEAAVLAQGWPASSASVENRYLDPDSGAWLAGPEGAAACPPDGDRPRLVKLVTISVTSEQEGITRSIEVVKSDV